MICDMVELWLNLTLLWGGHQRHQSLLAANTMIPDRAENKLGAFRFDSRKSFKHERTVVFICDGP